MYHSLNVLYEKGRNNSRLRHSRLSVFYILRKIYTLTSVHCCELRGSNVEILSLGEVIVVVCSVILFICLFLCHDVRTVLVSLNNGNVTVLSFISFCTVYHVRSKNLRFCNKTERRFSMPNF